MEQVPLSQARPADGGGHDHGGRVVFIRPDALALERPATRRRSVALTAPDAHRAIETLREFGFEVVLLRRPGPAPELRHRDWLLTSDPEDCRWARRAGGRTVLVGADATEQAGQPDRCDVTVNSVYSAAIEVVVGDPDIEHGEIQAGADGVTQPATPDEASGRRIPEASP